jgi:hypothetical protein
LERRLLGREDVDEWRDGLLQNQARPHSIATVQLRAAQVMAMVLVAVANAEKSPSVLKVLKPYQDDQSDERINNLHILHNKQSK